MRSAIFNSNVQALITITVILCTGFSVYSNIFNNEFVFDDIAGIQQNPRVCLKTLSLESLQNTLFGKWPVAITEGRPVVTLTFALNYYFGKYNVQGYHLVNIIIHIINSILFYFLSTAILRLLKKSSPDDAFLTEKTVYLTASIAALLWLIHPVQTQAVTYTVQRMTSLSTLFFLMSILSYILGRQQSGNKKLFQFSLSVFAGLLALGTKENAATLPFFIILTEFFFFQNLEMSWLKRNAPYFAGAFFVFIILLLFWIRNERFDFIVSGYDGYNFNLLQRVLTEFRVVVMYITLLFLPHPGRLHLDYNYIVSTSLFNPATTFFSLILILFLMITAIIISKKNKLLSFSIVWYFGNLFIESSFIPLDLVYEHRLYLPSMFLFLSFSFVLLRFIPKIRISISIVLVISIILSFWTYSRNKVWKNRLSVWEDSISKSPPKARAFINLGAALLKEKNYSKAIIQFKKAIDLDPGYAFASYNNWGYALLQQGKPGEAIHYFKIATKMKNDYPIAYKNWGDALRQLGKTDAAIEKYHNHLKYLPASTSVLNRLAEIYASKKKYEKAAELYEHILYLKPENAEICYNLACMYALLNKKEPAVYWLQKAVFLGFDNKNTITNDSDLSNLQNTEYYKSLMK